MEDAEFESMTEDADVGGRAEAPAGSDGSATPAEGAGATVGDLQERLDEATARAEEYLDRLQRLQADFANFRKRKQREVEEARRQGNERLISELLDILGNFDRALEASSGADESLYDGVTLIFKQLRGLLEREGVERIEAEGHPFDPEVHEAVMREETDAYAEGVVIKELEKGWMLNGRVLRPAKVKVATTPGDGH